MPVSLPARKRPCNWTLVQDYLTLFSHSHFQFLFFFFFLVGRGAEAEKEVKKKVTWDSTVGASKKV